MRVMIRACPRGYRQIAPGALPRPEAIGSSEARRVVAQSSPCGGEPGGGGRRRRARGCSNSGDTILNWLLSTKVGWPLAGSRGKGRHAFTALGHRHYHKRRPSRGIAADAVWHHHGARVARQRCPTLRDGPRSIPVPAGGCKAINASSLCSTPASNPPTFRDKNH